MGNSSNSNSNSEMIGFTGKMLMVSVILFFFIAGFILFLQFYAKWFWYTQDEETRQRTRTRRRRLDFSPGYSTESSAAVIPKQKRSLDPLVLKSLPIVDYDSKDFKEGLECAVCLSDLSDGEKLRLLPKCNHGFHLECIDMWFQSHSTCPLCRNAIIGNGGSELNSLETVLGLPIGEIPDDGPNFPTNVLFCGDETRIVTFGVSGEDVNSSSSSSAAAAVAGMVVVDIPATATGTARQGNHEDEGGKSPLTTRMRSLKRLLSRDKERRLNPSGSGSSSVELEQGNRGQS